MDNMVYVDGLPQEGFVRLQQILNVFPVSQSYWLRGVRSGKYPAPVKLTSKTVAWHVEDIRAVIESYKDSKAGE